ncbi:MAG: response regulator [Betaproteobacteria bacterium]|nr:response regulator [Betaproteobacteria bacterium]MBK7655843.1 response regulator [Betaproteobacteria bacterium]MBP7780046.1 response regulator [Burkholderiaceae bacterium]
MKLENAKILVVDDDPVISRFVVRTLERLGIKTVELCHEVNSAVHLMTTFLPDLIITDIHMKPINGIEFVQRLRSHANPNLQRIPVIFISADSSRETLKSALPLGSVGYIVKPPRLEVLKTKIEQALHIEDQDFENW